MAAVGGVGVAWGGCWSTTALRKRGASEPEKTAARNPALPGANGSTGELSLEHTFEPGLVAVNDQCEIPGLGVRRGLTQDDLPVPQPLAHSLAAFSVRLLPKKVPKWLKCRSRKNMGEDPRKAALACQF